MKRDEAMKKFELLLSEYAETRDEYYNHGALNAQLSRFKVARENMIAYVAGLEELRAHVQAFLDTIPAMPQVELVAGRYTWEADQLRALIALSAHFHGEKA